MAAEDVDTEGPADAVAFLRDRAASETPLLRAHFERAATKLEETLTERREH